VELQNKIAFVTGGSRGIGAAIVEAFRQEGAEVYFSYQSSKDLALALCNKLDISPDHAFCCDVRDRQSVKVAMAQISERAGRIDVLVNNAGINHPNDFDCISDEEWDDIFAVNLKGPFIVTQEALSLLRCSSAGSVIHIGSVSGQYGGPRTAHYAASKAGLMSLSQVIARFLAEDGIRSNTLAAGLIVSDMADAGMANPAVQKAAQSIPQKRLGTTQEVAASAVFLASDRSSYITAQTLSVNGGLYF
jgi:3-oxoacyl-[acyl-carrier protein] reductase